MSINGGWHTFEGIIRVFGRCNCQAHCFATCYEFKDWWSSPANVSAWGESTATAVSAIVVCQTHAADSNLFSPYEAWCPEVWWIWSNRLDLQDYAILWVSLYAGSREVNHCLLLHGGTSTRVVSMDASKRAVILMVSFSTCFSFTICNIHVWRSYGITLQITTAFVGIGVPFRIQILG